MLLLMITMSIVIYTKEKKIDMTDENKRKHTNDIYCFLFSPFFWQSQKTIRWSFINENITVGEIL